jgi:hypothetical protein
MCHGHRQAVRSNTTRMNCEQVWNSLWEVWRERAKARLSWSEQRSVHNLFKLWNLGLRLVELAFCVVVHSKKKKNYS